MFTVVPFTVGLRKQYAVTAILSPTSGFNGFCNKKFELMLTRRAKAYSMPMLISNRFSRKTGQHRKNSDFCGVLFFDALVRRFFERKNRDLDR